MNELIRHIEYLLRSHDCVVVPAFGAFVLQYHEARYDAVNRCFLPPSATVIFNPDLSHNDGLLATSVARKESIPYERAARFVADEIAGMKSQLQNDGELQAGHLGRFSIVDGRTIFQPEEDTAIAPSLAHLEKINITKIVDRTSAGDEIKAENKVRIIHISRWMKAAAAIAVIFIMGALFSTPLLTDRDNLNFAGISFSVNEQPEENFEPTAIDIDLNIALPSDESDGFAVADTIRRPYRQTDSDPYYLVVASLANRQQAESFVKQKEGKWPLKIVERTGKTRVIAATGQSANEVMEPTTDKNFADCFPDAWPCHR